MKTDSKLREDVIDQLSWEPNLNEKQIGVAVENGVVTLSGVVNDYSQKMTAESAAKKVSGVKAVAEEIEVKYGDSFKKTDQEIAKAAVKALDWNIIVPDNQVIIKVEDGWVYLTGHVKWDYQRNGAKRAVENLLGVRCVVNNISLKQEVKATDIKDNIKNAFERIADVDAKHITVEVDEHNVTLKGMVHSLAEKDEASRTAYSSAGVYYVKNELKVEYYPAYA